MKCDYCGEEIKPRTEVLYKKEFFHKECLEKAPKCVSCREIDEDLNNLGLCKTCDSEFEEYLKDYVNDYIKDNLNEILEGWLEE